MWQPSKPPNLSIYLLSIAAPIVCPNFARKMGKNLIALGP
ncbi:hypothetical protein SLEP1_g6659 [Rubroshorea leprosula]|uniref:Uncharacterized protein n=1 Tax=Rubroshorea leprosula TaxID=152421 RepID=A0AAV5I408_9ROSI|nr:hypothetical protein SLEP1_g6659 [Rubroshorea leprosula]